MHSAKSPINKRYFFFRSKQFLPYALIMTLIAAATVLVINFSAASSNYKDLSHIVDEKLLLFPGWVFMYIYPVLTSLFLFSFLHKKNASDLFTAAPITKKEYYLTNMLIAFVYFTAIILVMMLFSLMSANIFNRTPNTLAVSFDSFMNIFLFLLIGFMQVYTITATAATLTGTVPAQLFTAAAFLLVPTALLLIFQFPIMNDVSVYCSAYTSAAGKSVIELTGKNVDSVFYPLNIGASPLSAVFTQIIISRYDEACGMLTHIASTASMVYSIVLTMIYAAVGIKIFAKYKTENVERAFTNERFGLAVRASVFLPVLTFSLTVFYQDGYFLNSVFLILFTFISVAYIVADLVLRKGINGFGKSLMTYGIVAAISLVGGVSLGVITDNTETTTEIYAENIENMSFYLEPLNMTPIRTENVRNTLKAVQIDDAELIKELVFYDKESDDGAGSTFWAEIRANGKKYFARMRLSGSGTERLYKYIDDNPDIKKSLIINTGITDHVKADVVLTHTQDTYTDDRSYLTTLTNRSDIKKLRKAFEEELESTPCSEIYANKKDRVFINGYNMSSEGTGITDNRSEMMLVEIKYINGMYYYSASEIPYGSTEFLKVFESFEKTVDNLTVKHEDAVFIPIAGLDLDKTQIQNFEYVLKNIPYALRKEFRETVLNSLDKDLICENSVVYAVYDGNKRGYFVLNTDRDLEELIERYADFVFEKIEQNDGSLYVDVNMYNRLSCITFKPYDQDAAVEELKDNTETLKRLFLKKFDGYALESFTGTFIYTEEITEKGKTEYITRKIRFPLDSSFTETLETWLSEYAKTDDIVKIEIQNYYYDGMLTFEKEDSEFFDMLRHTVAFALLDNYSELWDSFDYGYDYYPEITDSATYGGYSSYVVTKLGAYDTMQASYNIYSIVTYSDGETVELYLDFDDSTFQQILDRGITE